MKRRNLIVSSLAAAVAAPRIMVPAAARAMPTAARLTPLAAVASLVTPPVLIASAGGVLLFGIPTPARADPITLGILLMLGLVSAAVGQEMSRADELSNPNNWQHANPGDTYGNNVHGLNAGSMAVRPAARSLYGVNGVTVDTRRGGVELTAQCNANDKGPHDVSTDEAQVVKGTPFPRTARIEPNAEARRHLERAWAAMGGEFADRRIGYFRDFTDRSGSKAVRVSNGRTDTYDSAMMVFTGGNS